MVQHVINYDLPLQMYGGIDEYIHRIGRTARIGHKGLATSFYNDRNEDIAQALVNVMKENSNPVPDFLAFFKTEDEIDFEDDTDSEGDGEGNAAGGDDEDTGATGAFPAGADDGEEAALLSVRGASAPAEAAAATGW